MGKSKIATLPIVRTKSKVEEQTMKIIAWSYIIGHPNLFVKKGTRPTCTECGCDGLLYSKKIDGKFLRLCSRCYSDIIGEIPKQTVYFKYDYGMINKLITKFGFSAVEKAFYIIYRARRVFENDEHAFRSIYVHAEELTSGY